MSKTREEDNMDVEMWTTRTGRMTESCKLKKEALMGERTWTEFRKRSKWVGECREGVNGCVEARKENTAWLNN